MFTRIVECQVKPNKRDELKDRLRSEVLPLLQKQPGFVDLIGLFRRMIPTRSSPSASGTTSRTRSDIIAKITAESWTC